MMSEKRQEISVQTKRFAQLEIGALVLLGVINFGIYLKWQQPLYPVEYFLVLTGVQSFRVIQVISILFVAMCPYACLLLGLARLRHLRKKSFYGFQLLGGVLGFVGGLGYMIAVLYKEINYYHFHSFVFHDYGIFGLHIILFVYALHSLWNLRQHYITPRVKVGSIVLLVTFIGCDIAFNPWFAENRPLAFILSFVLLFVAYVISDKLLWLRKRIYFSAQS